MRQNHLQVLSSMCLVFPLIFGCAQTASSPESHTSDAGVAPASSERTEIIGSFFEILQHCQDVLMQTTYLEQVHEKVLASVSIALEPPFSETATLVITLGPVGYVEKLELRSVSSSSIEPSFQLLVEAPPALPRAPLEVRQCLGERPFPLMIGVAAKFQCLAQEEYHAYRTKVEQLLYPILYSEGYSSKPGRGWVRVGLTLGSRGQVWDVEVLSKSNAAAVAKLQAAIRAVGTFPPPPDFSRCFAEKPMILRLEVQGQ